MAVAMQALDAAVETVDAAGKIRSIALADFYRAPGTTPHLETNVAPGELITAVTLPKPIGGTHIYQKVRDRASYAFELISRSEEHTSELHSLMRISYAGFCLKKN